MNLFRRKKSEVDPEAEGRERRRSMLLKRGSHRRSVAEKGERDKENFVARRRIVEAISAGGGREAYQNTIDNLREDQYVERLTAKLAYVGSSMKNHDYIKAHALAEGVRANIQECQRNGSIDEKTSRKLASNLLRKVYKMSNSRFARHHIRFNSDVDATISKLENTYDIEPHHTLESYTAKTLTIVGFAGAIVFFSSNLTGNAIGGLGTSTGNYFGLIFGVLGIIGAYSWMKMKKRVSPKEKTNIKKKK